MKTVSEDKVDETIKVRGIASAIEQMAFPNFQNLNELLQVEGYKLTKINRDGNNNFNKNQRNVHV
jgi:hypothetical protein